MSETTRQREYRRLRQEEYREKMVTADRLRETGHAAAALEIERGLGLMGSGPVDQVVEDAVSSLEGGRVAEASSGLEGLTKAQMYEVQKRLSPKGLAAWDTVLENLSERALREERGR